MSNNDYTKYAKIREEAVKVESEPIVETVPEKIVEPIVEPVVEVKPQVETAVEVVADPEPEADIPQRKIGRVFNCAKLNVRSKPNSKAEVVCELFCNAEVEIDENESTNVFYKICTASGIEGFCMKDYILEK